MVSAKHAELVRDGPSDVGGGSTGWRRLSSGVSDGIDDKPPRLTCDEDG